MEKQSALFAFATLALCYGAASAQEQMPAQHDAWDAPASSQATSPERSPAVTLPEVQTRAPETTGAPVAETTGQAPKFEDRWSGQPEPSRRRRHRLLRNRPAQRRRRSWGRNGRGPVTRGPRPDIHRTIVGLRAEKAAVAFRVDLYGNNRFPRFGPS